MLSKDKIIRYSQNTAIVVYLSSYLYLRSTTTLFFDVQSKSIVINATKGSPYKNIILPHNNY